MCVGLAGDGGVTSVTMSIVLTIVVPITMSMPVTIHYESCYTSGHDTDTNADCRGYDFDCECDCDVGAGGGDCRADCDGVYDDGPTSMLAMVAVMTCTVPTTI